MERPEGMALRDSGDAANWFEIVSTTDSVSGYQGMMAFKDVCPRDLPLLEINA